MTPRRDLVSPWALHAKGWMFLVLAMLSGAMLLHDVFCAQRLALLLLAIWSSCRFYYFLFYVLERYAGRGRPYAGILDALGYLARGARDRRPPGDGDRDP